MHTPATKPRDKAIRGIIRCSLALVFAAATGRAGLPEPETIVYGTVSVNGMTLTASDPHYSLEARRSSSGPAIGVTHIGAEPSAGDFYVLRLPVESGLPLVNPQASLPGDSLVVVVLHDGNLVAQTALTVTGRGAAQRVDIGSTPPDLDDDTLPDPWEMNHFGVLDHGPGTPGLNGRSLLQNYIAGTDPNNPEDLFSVIIGEEGGRIVVGFLRRSAQGPGYEGQTRYYTLQSTSDLSGAWQDVPGYIGLPGDDSATVFQPTEDGEPGFYRALVWLE